MRISGRVMEASKNMRLYERRISIVPVPPGEGVLYHFTRQVSDSLEPGEVAVRLAVTESTSSGFQCELGIFAEAPLPHARAVSFLDFVPRTAQPSTEFNVVLVVPTGIGAEIGGHAGDAAPVAHLLGELCDTLITHPNVVNASDINELPSNGLYVEGSVLSRLLMGTVGIQQTRSNRLLVVIDAHEDELFVNAAINTVNAARAAYGLDCSRIVKLDPPVKLVAEYAPSGRAGGRIEQLESLFRVLEKYRDEYDAVAISSVIQVPHQYHSEYFEQAGEMVNPWGGVEAILTHAISEVFGIPTAHSPMLESREIANIDPGAVDPRMAAEAVSLTFLQCILKGLHKSPRIVGGSPLPSHPDVLTAANVSCVVLPDGCLGLPTLAALEQGIPVVTVTENRNLMRNDLSLLPWAKGQFYRVDNYWEAAGVIAAIKAGVPPHSVRRPLASVTVSAESGSEAPCEAVEKSAVLSYPSQ